MAQENPPQENSELRTGDAEAPEVLEEPCKPEASEASKRGIVWREILRQAFEKARQAQQPVSTRRDLSKDKSKSLLVLVGAAALMLLVFLAIFSAPQKPKKIDTGRRPGTPDLGRRSTPGEESTLQGSVTPMLNADVSGGQPLNSADVTPEDVNRTARLGPAQGHATVPGTQGVPPKKGAAQYALGRVDFSDPALAQQAGYGVGPAYPHSPAPPADSTESEELRKPSLVFIRSPDNSVARAAEARPAVLEQNQILSGLPAGTRLVARLESAVSTAVKEPVVAVIEYNYERDSEIVVPAGAKAVGQLRQADRSGYVDIRFDTLEMPDRSREKMDGVAMDLKFEPLKGSVSGKKTGTKFLVSAFTGLGTVAAYLVGNGGSSGFYGPVSESTLLRERVANNVGIASDQELNELALNQNVVVTVPGNTRFYIVLETGALERGGASTQPTTLASTGSRSATVPSLDELRQLLQLKQELSTMYQQAGTSPAATPAPQQ
jgi:hypothetical protein